MLTALCMLNRSFETEVQAQTASLRMKKQQGLMAEELSR